MCSSTHINQNSRIYLCVSARMHFGACVKSSLLDTRIMQSIGASDERRHRTTRRHKFCPVQRRSSSWTKRWKDMKNWKAGNELGLELKEVVEPQWKISKLAM
jgi:hypothetical protein